MAYEENPPSSPLGKHLLDWLPMLDIQSLALAKAKTKTTKKPTKDFDDDIFTTINSISGQK
jgi:hypothetical protein